MGNVIWDGKCHLAMHNQIAWVTLPQPYPEYSILEFIRYISIPVVHGIFSDG